MTGKIVTFYSYKGGVGCSMTLANVAWILASNGKRVLVIDWHMDAPGLHRYFGPFLIDRQLTESRGMMEFVTDYAVGLASQDDPDGWRQSSANILRYAVSVDWRFPNAGGIDLVPAGRSGPSYSVAVSAFDWVHFFERLGGASFLDEVKKNMRSEYDYVLIDSQPGVSQISGICTVHMPDELVVCCALNHQNIAGAAAIARSVQQQRQNDPCLIFPALMRVDWNEKLMLEEARQDAAREFEPVLGHVRDRGEYWGDVEFPYTPYYSYVEVLAPFVETSRSSRSILAASERLTKYITEETVTRPVSLSEIERRSGLSAFLNGSRYQVTANSLLLIADGYFRAENFAEAVKAATQAIELQPSNPSAYDQRASALWYSGRLPEAITDYTRVLELEPNSLSAFNGRGQCLAEKGDYAAAVTDLRRALAQAEQQGDRITAAYSRNGLGLAHAGLGRYEEAIETFGEALRDTPNNAWLYYNRAQAYEWMKETNKAREDYRVALEKQEPPLNPLKREHAQKQLGQATTSK